MRATAPATATPPLVTTLPMACVARSPPAAWCSPASEAPATSIACANVLTWFGLGFGVGVGVGLGFGYGLGFGFGFGCG